MLQKRMSLNGVLSVFVCVMCAVGGAGRACAWDVEHDEVAQLVGESLPAEIKASFDFDDFGVLMAFCHFPDMMEWEPRRFSCRSCRKVPENGLRAASASESGEKDCEAYEVIAGTFAFGRLAVRACRLTSPNGM